MSDPQMVTEAEAVRRERAAFVRGAKTSLSSWRAEDTARVAGKMEVAPEVDAAITGAAAILYPLPTVRRERVVATANALRYRVRSGVLEVQVRADVPTGWTPAVFVHPENIPLLAELLANPTELVEEG